MPVFTAGSTKWLDADGTTVYDEGSEETPANGSTLLVRAGQTFEIVSLVSDGAPSSELGAQPGDYCVDGANGVLYVNVGNVANNNWKQIAEGSL